MSEQLTVIEKKRLAELEGIIQKNLPQITMTVFEARECVKKINENIQNTRTLLLELYEKKGWEALGYDSWEKCVTNEFKQHRSFMYRQLAAAKAEMNVSPKGDIGQIPETHLRPLASLPPEQQREVYQKAVETAPGNKVTARHIAEVIERKDKAISIETMEDSDSLFQLKRWWKKATKKDKQNFLLWIKEAQ